MRLCPTVEGSPSPLITHRIGVDVCLARQGENFHKCHKCIYRGKAADWVTEQPEELVIELEAGQVGRNGSTQPSPARTRGEPGAPRRKRAPAKAPAKARNGKVAETEA